MTMALRDVPQSEFERHEFLAGSRVLLAACRTYCRSASCRPGDVIHSGSAGENILYFVEEGMALGSKYLRNGATQVVALYVSGDIINHEAVTFGRSLAVVSAVTDVKLARITTRDFIQILDGERQYERLFHRFVAYQAILAQEWLGVVGRRSGVEKTAHLLCELYCRQRISAANDDGTCLMPLKQAALADILGLSAVHQNRSLKYLKSAGLISITNRRLRILDWMGLAKLAGFDRAYLDVAMEAPRERLA